VFTEIDRSSAISSRDSSDGRRIRTGQEHERDGDENLLLARQPGAGQCDPGRQHEGQVSWVDDGQQEADTESSARGQGIEGGDPRRWAGLRSAHHASSPGPDGEREKEQSEHEREHGQRRAGARPVSVARPRWVAVASTSAMPSASR
jgi:hypothetical protein